MKFNRFFAELFATLTALFQTIGLFAQGKHLEGKIESLKAGAKAREKSRTALISLMVDRIYAHFYDEMNGKSEVIKYDEHHTATFDALTAICNSTRGLLGNLLNSGSLNGEWDKFTTPDKKGNLPTVGKTIFAAKNGATLEQSHDGELLKIETTVSYTARDKQGKVEKAILAALAALDLAGKTSKPEFAKAKVGLTELIDLFSLTAEEVDTFLFHAEKTYELNRLNNMLKANQSAIKALTGSAGASKHTLDRLALYAGSNAIVEVEQLAAKVRILANQEGVGANYSEAKNAINRKVTELTGNALRWDFGEVDLIAIKTQKELKAKAKNDTKVNAVLESFQGVQSEIDKIAERINELVSVDPIGNKKEITELRKKTVRLADAENERLAKEKAKTATV